MTLLTILNLDFKDVITLVITPAVLAAVGFIKYLQAEREKHKANLQNDLDKEQMRIAAEVEKEKIRVQGEVEKLKEKSVGAEAVVKIWKEMNEIHTDMEKLTQYHSDEHTNYILVKEILTTLKADYDRLMKSLFEKFLNTPT